MDMAGFGTGMGAGIGAGMALGVSSGRQQALKQIRNHVEHHGITIQDRYGAPLKVDQFLSEACGQSPTCSSIHSRTAVIYGGLFMLAAGLAAAIGIYMVFAL